MSPGVFSVSLLLGPVFPIGGNRFGIFVLFTGSGVGSVLFGDGVGFGLVLFGSIGGSGGNNGFVPFGGGRGFVPFGGGRGGPVLF